MKEKNERFFRKIFSFLELLVSMLGFVPRHMTISRVLAFGISILFSIYLAVFQQSNFVIAIIYFSLSEILYIGYLMMVLSEDGLRLRFRKKWIDEDESFRAHEGIVGLLFFHNAASIGYVASSTSNEILFTGWNMLFLVIVGLMFATGFFVKILAARVVTIDIYYWKDMFLGRKVSEFVVSGPYKYFSNPMYGIGQIPAYAAALLYGSVYGLAAAMINQVLIYVFYYFFERKFIRRVYIV